MSRAVVKLVRSGTYCKRVKQEVQDGSRKDEAGTLKLQRTRQTRY
jgi:hypothetical protein